MSGGIVVLDVETLPSQDPAVREQITATITAPGNYTKPESIAKWEAEVKPGLVDEAVLRTSFDATHGMLAVIGLAFDDEEPQAIYDKNWLENEAKILEQFFQKINERYSDLRNGLPRFVGHNILDFDLRFIWQRAVILGIRPPPIIPFDAKPWSDRIFDTMTAWAGMKNRISLDKLCSALGIPGKGGISGADVWPMIQAGKIVEVADYCRNDISITRAAYKRMTWSA